MKRIVSLIVIFLFLAQLTAQEKSYAKSGEFAFRLSEKNVRNVENKLHQGHKALNLIALNKKMQNGTKLGTMQRLDSLCTETFTGTWIPGYKLLFTWGPSQLLLKQEELNYIDSSSQWVPYSRETYEYAPNGDPVKITSEYYNESTSQWEGDQKTEYTWNAGNIETETIWYWDISTTGWLLSRKGTYAYNATGLVTSIIWEYWDESISQWYVGYMEQYTYNTSSLVVQILYSMWNDPQQIYEAMGKDEFQYHANGKVSLYMSSFYDTFLAQWIPEWKTEYTYDGQGNNTVLLESSYDPGTSQWGPTSKSEKSFDVNNNLVSQIFSSYDDNNSQWEMEMKGDYSFNNSYDFNDLILPFLFIDDETRELLNHMITNYDYYYYDDVSLTWTLFEKAEFFWTQTIINIEKIINDNAIQVYPNPASDFIIVDKRSKSDPSLFELFDIHGRLVMSTEVSDNITVSISDIGSGFYLYRITDGQTVIKQDKLIINR